MKVDLMEIVGGDLMKELVSNLVLLCDIIYCVCKPQADKAEISDEDFAGLLGGDSIDGATKAFMEAMVEFFPLAKREPLRKAMDKMKEIEKRSMEALSSLLDDPNLDTKIELALKNAGGSSGKSPGEPASTPAP